MGKEPENKPGKHRCSRPGLGQKTEELGQRNVPLPFTP
jgi:hypothetical protein